MTAMDDLPSAVKPGNHRRVALPPAGIGTIGNRSLLAEPLTALFCSARCPGELILRTYDLARELRDAGVAIIGGFQTPMEREYLRLLLRGRQPLVICPARSIAGMRIPASYRPALAGGAAQRIRTVAGRPRHHCPRRAGGRNGGAGAAGGGRRSAAAHPGQPGQRQPAGLGRAAHTWRRIHLG